MKKIIALDVGSSAIKACAFEFDETIKLLYSNTLSIGLYSNKPGYAEHDANEVWEKTCEAIKSIFDNTDIKNDEICCLSICSQAQCVVLVDKNGNALTPIYNSQDARATDTFKKYYGRGFTVDGVNLRKALTCYAAMKFMPGSAKDPVFKFKWAQDNLDDEYKNSYKWLDIKDFIIQHLTGVFTTTKDNAHAYTIYNSKKNNGSWSNTVCKMFKVDKTKLPKVVESTDIVGYVNAEIATKTGLIENTPVIGGIIDSTGVQYGSGATMPGEVMIYWGTSGWVGTVTKKLQVDLFVRSGSLITAKDKTYHYYAVLDSAGISYRWLKEHLVADDGLLKIVENMSDSEIYEHINSVLNDIKPGSDGVMYTPWLTGCRAPQEASDIGAMFINVKRFMGKKHIARAVIEGICYHYRLLKEAGIKEGRKANVIKFVGGGAKSPEIAQILADITGCKVEVPDNPQDCGAYGAAIVGFAAMSDSKYSIDDLAHKLNSFKVYRPNEETHEIYNKYFNTYKKVYFKSHKLLSELSKISESVGE